MRKELKAGDFEAAARLDFEFHRRILLASGNQAMLSILSASAEIFLESQKLPFIRPNGPWKPGRSTARSCAPWPGGPVRCRAESHAGTRTQCGIAHRHRLRDSRDAVTWAIPKLMRRHSKTQSDGGFLNGGRAAMMGHVFLLTTGDIP